MSESYLRALIYSHISSFVIYDYQKGGKFKEISCFLIFYNLIEQDHRFVLVSKNQQAV